MGEYLPRTAISRALVPSFRDSRDSNSGKWLLALSSLVRHQLISYHRLYTITNIAKEYYIRQWDVVAS